MASFSGTAIQAAGAPKVEAIGTHSVIISFTRPPGAEKVSPRLWADGLCHERSVVIEGL